MTDYSDLDPAILKPGLTTPDGANLKPSLVTSDYTGGTPSAANQIKPSLRNADGSLKAGLLTDGALAASLTNANASLPDPSIVTQPENVTIDAGDTLELAVVAAGTGTLTYRWRKWIDDAPVEIEGATSSTFTKANATVDDAGYYDVVVEGDLDPVTSEISTVTVNAAADALVDAFRLDGTTYFQDTANCPANTTVLEWETKCIFPTHAAIIYFHQIVSCAIARSTPEGATQLNVEDAAGVEKYNSGTVLEFVPVGSVVVLNTKVDFDNLTAVLSINGTPVISGSITDSPGQNSFQTTRKIAFGGASQRHAADTDVEYHKVWRTTSGVRTLHKEISVAALGSIANIDSDAWKINGTVTATP